MRVRPVVPMALAVAALLLAAVSVWASSAALTVVSRPGFSGSRADDFAERPAISADSCFVAFHSTATNLSDVDHDRAGSDLGYDVFVRDVDAGTIELVSRASGASGAAGNGDSYSAASISSDGRYVAFSSEASNLMSETMRAGDSGVFVRDRQTLTTVRIDRASGATGAVSNRGSGSPAISADGRVVAFVSDSSNLTTDPARTNRDAIFVRDLDAATTVRVDRASGATGAVANDDSHSPSISSDGRYVAFISEATNLSAADQDDVDDIFVRDLEARTTKLVSRASGSSGAGADADAGWPSISGDGRYVAFSSEAQNLSASDRNLTSDIFVRDRTAVSTSLISRASGSGGSAGNDDSDHPSISANGRYVAYDSEADNLSPHKRDTSADSEDGDDIYVRDRSAKTTTLITRSLARDITSTFPVISSGSRAVAFEAIHQHLAGAAHTGTNRQDMWVWERTGQGRACSTS